MPSHPLPRIASIRIWDRTRTAVRNQRKKIWISGFQTKLSVRIAVYFALYQMLVWFIAIFERHAATVLNMTENQGPKFEWQFPWP